MKVFFTILTVLLFSKSVYSSSISGFIYDKNSKEQLVGASITLNPLSLKSTALLNGKYLFNNVAAGKYSVSVSYLGYKSETRVIEVKTSENSQLNFYLETNSSALNGVTVMGKADKESESYSKRVEQKSNNLVNIVSANAIALSPDITVANVMARISGVSVERGNNGDGQHAIIRGMDKRYNTTLINGVKIPSPDNKNRYIPLDIFPADLVERIEVSKSLTPNMEGDASGGVINLVMKTAPDQFRLEGNFGAGYSQLFSVRPFDKFSTATINSKSPAEILGNNASAPISSFPYQNLLTTQKKYPLNSQASLTFGDRFLNKKLGFIFSGSYQNVDAGSNGTLLAQNATVGPSASSQTQMNQTFPEYSVRNYSSSTSRLGLISTIDYKFNKNNSISLFGTYLQLNEDRVRQSNINLLGNYSYNGYVGIFENNNQTQTRQQLQSIYSTILRGKHNLSESFNTDWSLVYSKAAQQLPDVATFNISQQVSPNLTDQTVTSLSYAPNVVRGETRNWNHNTDKDLSGYLNLNYKTTLAGRKILWGFGGMYRHKNRDNYANAYKLDQIPDPNSGEQLFTTIPQARFNFNDPLTGRGNAFSNGGVYTFNENILGSYGQAKYYINKKFDVLFGLRIENTQQDYVSSLPVSFAGKSAKITYIDYLPSVNAKYALTDKQALRFSYFTSILRPGYSDLVPYRDNSGANGVENFATIGNPYLQHSVINNLDFRYEVFPKGLDQFMVGAFYKVIHNPIEYALAQLDFAADLTLQPQNFGTAHNYGLEAVFTKFFGKVGFSGNYTYTKSAITSDKRFDYRDPVTNQYFQTITGQKRPLQGQSANVGNFSALYKDTEHKFDAQLAMVYTGERIAFLSAFKDLDDWETATVNLDLSLQKQFSKHYTVYLKANNLLNTPYKLIIKQQNNGFTGNTKLPIQEAPNYVVVEKDLYYARYLLGVRFKF
jgi:outer membrane receptor protein involved in Fe transport